MIRILIFVAGAMMLVLSGLVHGLWTQRWGTPVEFSAAAARLQEFPLDVGDWEGGPIELDAEVMARAEAAGYVWRVFRHRTKGEVNMLLICGRPGPISVHTPEVCFPGSGLSLNAEPDRWTLKFKNAADAQFLVARFHKSGPARQWLRVFWSFTDGNGWQAPNNPRVTFARAGILYKLYLMRDMMKVDESVKDDPANELLRVLLPELDKYLSPSSRAASSAD
jgi:hypothetical protein